MPDCTVNVEKRADGTVVAQWHGDVDADSAQHLRRVLVYAVRRVRPGRLILDLSDVSHIDPINLGALAAACELATDHQINVFLGLPSNEIARQLATAGVPRQYLRLPARQE